MLEHLTPVFVHIAHDSVMVSVCTHVEVTQLVILVCTYDCIYLHFVLIHTPK